MSSQCSLAEDGLVHGARWKLSVISVGGLSKKRTVAVYVYIPFDILPFIGFRNDFAVEGGSGVRHVGLRIRSFSLLV